MFDYSNIGNQNHGMPVWKKVLKRTVKQAASTYRFATPKPKMPFDAAFAVGAYKTGTTSLNHFLTQNGLRHMTITRRGKEAHDQGDYAYLEKAVAHFHSFDDNPWNKLDVIEHFAQQDKDFRFILTTRAPEAWFPSLQRHNKRIGRDVPPDETREDMIEEHLTGRAEKVREIVAKYGKPLLEIDLTEDADREAKLLAFLGLPDKGVSFPHSNNAKRHALNPKAHATAATTD